MPAYFETGFSGNNVPMWHGLGTVVEGLLTAESALTTAELNWQVAKQPLFFQAPDGEIDPIEDKFAMVRDFDNRCLGIVGSNYTPLQNAQAFDFFDSIVDKGEAVFETAGSLKEGRVIWIMAKLPSNIVVKGKDIIEKYLLLANSHDGTTGVQVKLTGQRVVCANTLAMALKGGSYNIRHTANVHEKVKQAAEVMGFANKGYDNLAEVYEQMSKVKMNHDQTLSYLKRCLKKSEHQKRQEMSESEFLENNEKEEKDSKALVTMTRLIEEGQGTDIPGVKGTLWGAYNVVTEFSDHYRGYRTDDARMFNAAFGGQGMILKTKAYQEATKLLKV